MLLSVIAGAILFFTYLVFAVGRAPYLRIDRPGAAIVGATLMLATGVISLDEAYRHVDFRTLILLFGMMVLIAHLRMARFFRTIVRWVGAHVHEPTLLLVAVVFVSGTLSALFVNDTICLVFTPVLIEVARARGHRPLPYLLALATASNIGSVATITGNPQNMLIASLSQIGYAPFLSALGPVALFGLSLDAAMLAVMFRRDLRPGPLEHAGRPPRPIHRAMMIKGLVVTVFVLTAFLMGKDPAIVAAVGAAALLITRRVKPQKIYRQIDWDLLVLFIGLFVIIGGVEQAGLAPRLFDLLAPIGLQTVSGLSVVAAVVSNVISNVPAVMLLSRLVPQLPDPTTSWLTLAMSSTLAGNLTLVGSIANLIVLEGARHQGEEIRFWQYCRVGVPLTLLTVGFGILWLGWWRGSL
jgi:Na+/H+ antiporter NhaD/arsenite permease-like protein